MANWQTLKESISDVIKTNGNQEITGAVLQNTLNSMVSALGANATFCGVAHPSTNPGTPDGPVFYLVGEAGTYAHFQGVVVGENQIGVLMWDTESWRYDHFTVSGGGGGESGSCEVAVPKICPPFNRFQLKDITEKLIALDSTSQSGVKMNILFLGGTDMADSLQYTKQLIDSFLSTMPDEMQVQVYCAYSEANSFKYWYDVLVSGQDKGEEVEPLKPYQIVKICSGPSFDEYNPRNMPELLNGPTERTDEGYDTHLWDIIILQPNKDVVPYYDKWESESEDGYLTYFLGALRHFSTIAVHSAIGLYMTPAYWGGDSRNTEGSSLKRWEKIAESTKKFMTNYGVDFIIPCGTAIQNLRASSLNNEYDLTADGYALADGIAATTASLVIAFGAIMQIFGLTQPTYPVPLDEIFTKFSPWGYESSFIQNTEQTDSIVKKAAFLAMSDMFRVHNPEEMSDDIFNIYNSW